VVIAARNEEAFIGAAVRSAFEAGAAEVIVADGASSDRTRELASAAGARVLEGRALRAGQFNAGAAAASGEVLMFLHADTTLPAGACQAAAAAVDEGAAFGGFLIRFAERSLRLRYVAFMVNLRTRITRRPWGDQAQFVSRAAFQRFREIPIMEDYELAARLSPRAVVPMHVTTSGRRFLARGVVRTSAVNWLVIAGWYLGVSPATLARWYRRS
jgi:rSAM/selenodomain-associated transferase 2